jgi:hypothetical protein
MDVGCELLWLKLYLKSSSSRKKGKEEKKRLLAEIQSFILL